jgi:hypothetical protein
VRLIALVLTVMCLTLSAVACGGDDKKTPDELDVGTELPADWPKEFPIYPGAKLTGVVSSTETGEEGTVATYETDDKSADVVAFYREKLGSGRWKSVQEIVTGDGATFDVQSSDGAAVGSSVTIASEENKTMIIILLSKAPAG